MKIRKTISILCLLATGFLAVGCSDGKKGDQALRPLPAPIPAPVTPPPTPISPPPPSLPGEDCEVAADEDGDGLVDCANPDCQDQPLCVDETEPDDIPPPEAPPGGGAGGGVGSGPGAGSAGGGARGGAAGGSGGGAGSAEDADDSCHRLRDVKLEYEIINEQMVLRESESVYEIVGYPGLRVRFSVYTKFDDDRVWRGGRVEWANYSWTAGPIRIPEDEAATTTFEKTFEETGRSSVEVTVSDRCRERHERDDQAFIEIRPLMVIQRPEPAKTFRMDIIREGQPFVLNQHVPHSLALAMNDKHAVLIGRFGKNVWYKVLDLVQKNTFIDWTRLEKPRELQCREDVLFGDVSVAINSDSSKVVIAFEKWCQGKENVVYEVMTRRDGSFREESLNHLGQSGEKWNPIVLVNSEDDFGIAWIMRNEEIYDVVDDDGDIYGHHITIDRAYLKILPAQGVPSEPRGILRWWVRTVHEVGNLNVYAGDQSLRGAPHGALFCFIFDRVYDDYYRSYYEAPNTQQLICKGPNNATALHQSRNYNFHERYHSLASTKIGNNPVLVTARYNTSNDTNTIQFWFEGEEEPRQTFRLQHTVFDKMAALSVYGVLTLVGRDLYLGRRVSMTSAPFEQKTEIDYGEPKGVAANNVRQVLSVWVKDNGLYGVLDTLER